MKFRVLAIAILFAMCVRGVVFAQKIKTDNEYNALASRVSVYIEKENFAAAIPLLKRMHEFKPEELENLELLGIFYMSLPEEKPACANALLWLEEAEKRGSQNDVVYYNLACIYSIKKNMEKAETEMDKAVILGYSDFQWLSKDDDLVNFRTGSWWKGIANNYSWIEQQINLFREFVSGKKNKKPSERIKYYGDAATAFKKLTPNIPAFQYLPLHYLAIAYYDNENYDLAEKNYLEAKAILEKVMGKRHPYYASLLQDIGNLYYNMDEYAKAESYYLDAKVISEQVSGKRSIDYAASLNCIGNFYFDRSEYPKALPYYLESKVIYEQISEKNNPDYIQLLKYLGGSYVAMGDNAKAAPYFLELMAICEQVYGKNNIYYAEALNALGIFYLAAGDYTKAESFSVDSKNIHEQVLGKNYSSYAQALFIMGFLFLYKGDYAKSEQYFLEAKTVSEQVSGINSSNYADKLMGIGLFYLNVGDYAKAEQNFLEMKAVYEKIPGKPNYDVSLTSLGFLYFGMGDYAKAEQNYIEANAFYEQASGKNHPLYAVSLLSLGILYHKIRDYDKAEPYYQEAKTVFEQTSGKNHPYYAMSLTSMGFLYSEKGDLTKAESFFLEAKNIIEKTLGKNNNAYAPLLYGLNLLYQDTGNFAKVEAINKELCELNIKQINQNFSFMSGQQRDLYLKNISWFFDASYSLSMRYPADTINCLNYNNVLFIKGLLLRTTNAVRDAIYSSGDTALIEQFEQLGSLHRQITQSSQKEDANQEDLKKLEEQADKLEKAITRASSEFRKLKADMAMQWQTVRDSLQAGEAAVEFISFQLYDNEWTNTTQYAALVLKPKSKAPVWVPLCKDDDLKGILGKVEGKSQTAEKKAQVIYNANGLELYNFVWKPLEKELSGVKTVYYSPSGLLHKISFNALPIDNSFDKRLTDKYKLNLVSSTREVVHTDRKPRAVQINRAVLYGGLDYNADVNSMRKAAQSYKKEEQAAQIASAPSGSTARGSATRGSMGSAEPLDFLKNSLPEVTNIQDLLNRKKISNTLYQGSLGNEESFKQLSGQKMGLIHLATHGKFNSDVERKQDDRDLLLPQPQQQRINVLKDGENPLLRSWLLMAGGNHALTNNPPEGMENGILTAAEIAGIDLLGAKLVVLSACETGLGDVNNGEGVFGLQRAFKLAGVETLIMSLWEVSDEATPILMNTFYQEWLFSGKSKQEAFKEAQKKVRMQYPAPYYWAAFVMMD